MKNNPFLKAFEGCGEAFLEKFPTRVSPRISPLNRNLSASNIKGRGDASPFRYQILDFLQLIHLIGKANIDELGTRFPDMSHVYDEDLQQYILMHIALKISKFII